MIEEPEEQQEPPAPDPARVQAIQERLREDTKKRQKRVAKRQRHR